MKLYTDSKIEISKFIEQNRTMLINSRKEAEEITKYRGYFYEICNNIITRVRLSPFH